VLLPRGPALAHGGAQLSAGARLPQVRLLAQRGMNEQDLLPLLQVYASADAEVWMSAAAPAWLLYPLPLAGAASSRTGDPAGSAAAVAVTPAGLPAQALLVLGWQAQEQEQSLAAQKQGRALLPLLADVAGVLLSNLLLTEHVQAQQQARREQEVLPSDLLANVSHELRSPLTLIKGSAETLLRLDRRTSRQQRREFLRVINEASEELAVVIDRLLELAQLDSGSLRLACAPVNLAHLVAEALRSAQECLAAPTQQPGVPQAPVRFSWHLQDAQEGEPTKAEPLIQADRQRVREVLDHLLANAIAYSPTGGTIAVTIRPVSVQGLTHSVQRAPAIPTPGQTQDLPSSLAAPPQPGMELVVCDQGMGMPGEQLEQIFAPFQRLDTTLTRPVPGLGLGLTLCQRLVDLHDGRIWAESVVGEGSAFHVWLPATPEQEASL
jgi:signal transduction histidine kinase